VDFGPGGEGYVRLNFATSRQISSQILDQMEATLTDTKPVP
jgi:bifunctional pyridoxal-dependent enzyme with beta-cystathionase and maltose regulon repressor activities